MTTAISISQTAVPITAASKAAVAAADFFAVIDAPRPAVTGLKEPEISAQEDIIFEGVNFAYPSRSHVQVLDDLDLRFETGKLTAIVGASGSGKSTIVGLLERWYELDNERKIIIPPSAIKPDDKGKDSSDTQSEEKKALENIDEGKDPIVLSGSIKCGNNNLQAIDLKWWRSQIGLVQQEPFIFNATIHDNVEHGLIGSQWENEDAETKKKLVIDACKEAFADEFIVKLPLVRLLLYMPPLSC